MRYLLTVFAGLMLLTGCTALRQPRTSNIPRTVLEVENRGFPDMTVYVINGGQRIRLGTATGNRTTELTIPPSVASSARELQFLADPLGSSRTSVSEKIYVQPGDRVSLLILP